MYEQCYLCPRKCGINRLKGEKGYCKETSALRIAIASIHYGEEPPITGKGGSGTIFVTGCNLACPLCQNYQISREGIGKIVSTDEFAEICLKLQENKAENINIVTGSHAIPAIREGILLAKSQGLTLPIVWNTSSYESLEGINLLNDIVDIYLPDLKTLDEEIAKRFFNASDYPLYSQKAIKKMIESRPIKYRKNTDILISGVIIRHLILPDYLYSSRNVLHWFADNGQGQAFLSLMTQYTPIKKSQAEINRYVNEKEYETALEWLEEFGIEDGFYQELSPDSSWLPDFTLPNPFSSKLSKTIWHC